MLAHVKTIMAIFCIVSFVFARYLIPIGDYNCISWLCAAGLHCLFPPNSVDFSLFHFFTFSLCLKMLPPPPPPLLLPGGVQVIDSWPSISGVNYRSRTNNNQNKAPPRASPRTNEWMAPAEYYEISRSLSSAGYTANTIRTSDSTLLLLLYDRTTAHYPFLPSFPSF